MARKCVHISLAVGWLVASKNFAHPSSACAQMRSYLVYAKKLTLNEVGKNQRGKLHFPQPHRNKHVG